MSQAARSVTAFLTGEDPEATAVELDESERQILIDRLIKLGADDAESSEVIDAVAAAVRLQTRRAQRARPHDD